MTEKTKIEQLKRSIMEAHNAVNEYLRAGEVKDHMRNIIEAARAHLQTLKSGVDFERTVAPKAELQKLAIQNFTETHHKVSDDHLHAIGWVVDMLDYNGAFDGLLKYPALSTPPVDGDTKAELKIAKDFSCDGDKIRAAREDFADAEALEKIDLFEGMSEICKWARKHRETIRAALTTKPKES